MDYTGGIDFEERENGTVSIEPVAQAAQQHPPPSSEPDPQIAPSWAPASLQAPHSSFLLTGAPLKAMAHPAAVASALHTRPPDPPLATRTYPLGAGAPYNHSPWPNNSAVSRTPLPPSTWPPPPNWVPPAPYHGTNFPLPYPGPPAPFYANIPPPSYYRPPLTQPFVPLNPGEYVWNPSLGPLGDPSPPNAPNAPAAPAASPGPANCSANPSTTILSQRKQRRQSKDALQSRESSQGEKSETQANGDMEEAEEDGMEGKEGPKLGRNRAMFPNEKLALIGFCAKYADEYAMNQRQKYWGKIAYLLKEKTGYALKSPRLTVERWIRAQMGEHTLDRLGFTTQAELDEFHTAVEKFGERWQAVAEEKEHLQKSQAAMFASEKITKSQKDKETKSDPTLLQKRLIDTVEDEPLQTAGLENPARIPKGRSSPAVFPNRSLKRRKLEDSSHRLRETAELMVAGMRDSIGALTEGLRQSAEAVVGDRELIGRIEVLEKSNSAVHDAIERNSKTIGESSARLARVEEGVQTLLEFLTKKIDHVDNHSCPSRSRQAQ